jgi:hypothetical protein
MSAWLVSRWLVRSYCLILACGFFGCATTKVDWNSRVGKVTYDEIVVDMGPPDKQAKLQDGTCVAEWLTRRSSHVAYVGGFYGPGCYYYPPYYPAYTDYYSPDYYLRLVFDPEGRLQSWKQFRR